MCLGLLACCPCGRVKSQSRHRTERLRISLENEGQRAWPRRCEQQSSELPLRNVHATAPLLGSLPSAAGDTAIESLAFSAYLGTAHGVISDRHCVPAQPLPLPTLLPSLSSHRSRAQDTSTPALSTHAGPGRGGRCACHLRPGVHFQRESVTRGARAQTSVGLQAPLTPQAYLTSHTRKESHVFLTHTQREVHRRKRALLEERRQRV